MLSCSPHQHSVMRMVGHSVVRKRLQMEAGWRTYVEEVRTKAGDVYSVAAGSRREAPAVMRPSLGHDSPWRAVVCVPCAQQWRGCQQHRSADSTLCATKLVETRAGCHAGQPLWECVDMRSLRLGEYVLDGVPPSSLRWWRRAVAWRPAPSATSTSPSTPARGRVRMRNCRLTD